MPPELLELDRRLTGAFPVTLNLTINEAPGSTPPATPGSFVVRAKYTETDAGHLFGPFSTREKAEECAVTLAARTGVITATVENA